MKQELPAQAHSQAGAWEREYLLSPLRGLYSFIIFYRGLHPPLYPIGLSGLTLKCLNIKHYVAFNSVVARRALPLHVRLKFLYGYIYTDTTSASNLKFPTTSSRHVIGLSTVTVHVLAPAVCCAQSTPFAFVKFAGGAEQPVR